MTDTEIVKRVLQASEGTCIAISMAFQVHCRTQATICYWVPGHITPEAKVDVTVQESLLIYRETAEITSDSVKVCGTGLGLFALIYGRVIYKADARWQQLREAAGKIVALPAVGNETLDETVDVRLLVLKARAALGRARAKKGFASTVSLIAVMNSYSEAVASVNNCRIIDAGDIVVQLESIDMRGASVTKLALTKLIENDVDGAVGILYNAFDELAQVTPSRIAMPHAL